MKDLRNKLRAYYLLTKPGIVYGNSLAAIGGFFLASNGYFNAQLFVAMLSGTALIIASACVFNNYVDRGIDVKMARTKNRPLVTKTISGPSALLYGTILGLIGIFILGYYVNFVTLFVGLFGFLFYVVVYGYFKRTSVHGTLVGTIPGAVPPVAGYCAVTGRLDIVALLLFLILVFWQMPHFYAIAVYRMHDYAAASLPVLPLKHGIETTKRQIFFYIAAFVVSVLSLTILGITGATYAVIIGILGFFWLRIAMHGFTTDNNIRWARQVFKFSLILLLVFSLLLSIDVYLP